jgi:hypothetical protein
MGLRCLGGYGYWFLVMDIYTRIIMVIAIAWGYGYLLAMNIYIKALWLWLLAMDKVIVCDYDYYYCWAVFKFLKDSSGLGFRSLYKTWLHF